MDLLRELRFFSKFNGEIPRQICGKAADEIERLQKELLEADKEAPEASFDNIDDLLDWLDN